MNDERGKHSEQLPIHFPPTSLLCFILHTGYLRSRKSNKNCLCFALRSSLINLPKFRDKSLANLKPKLQKSLANLKPIFCDKSLANLKPKLHDTSIANLKPILHDKSLDGGITVCGFLQRLIVHHRGKRA